MLNRSYNLGMRHLKAFILEHLADTRHRQDGWSVQALCLCLHWPEPAEGHHLRAPVPGLLRLHIPIKDLYEIGVEVEENSELDLLAACGAHAGDPRIPGVCADMVKEMGEGCYVNSRPISRGTPEGDIAASDITFYRLQCASDGVLRAYIAQGEVLSAKTRFFGGIGVFAIPEMGRFYRHVLIQKRYPHHGAAAFGHYGKALFKVFKMLDIRDVACNQPRSLPYPTENPWTV